MSIYMLLREEIEKYQFHRRVLLKYYLFGGRDSCKVEKVVLAPKLKDWPQVGVLADTRSKILCTTHFIFAYELQTV